MRRALWVLALAACSRSQATERNPRPAPAPAAPAPVTAAAPATLPPPDCGPKLREPVPGLRIERWPATQPPPTPIGDRCLTLVRIDPARHRLQVLTALANGGIQTAPDWAAGHGLEAVINTSMFGSDLRSVGLLIGDGTVHSGHDNGHYGGFLAFDPVDAPVAVAGVAVFGRDCPGFDLAAVRKRYRSIVQDYRILDCTGRALPWKDDKLYSAAAIGVDRDGWLVLVHLRTPYQMNAFGQMMAAPELRLAGLLYVEGGPEASLYVHAGDVTVAEMGSFETGFHESDGNGKFWPIPNVLGVAARPQP